MPFRNHSSASLRLIHPWWLLASLICSGRNRPADSKKGIGRVANPPLLFIIWLFGFAFQLPKLVLVASAAGVVSPQRQHTSSFAISLRADTPHA